MQPNEMLQETQKTLNLLNDIREIDAILIQEQNGFGLDRQKAQTVIQKHNMTDSTIGFINNCTPNTVARIVPIIINALKIIQKESMPKELIFTIMNNHHTLCYLQLNMVSILRGLIHLS